MKRCVVCNEEFDIPGIRCRTCRAAVTAIKPKPVAVEADGEALSEEQKMGSRAVLHASIALAQHQLKQRMFRRAMTRRGA